MVKRARSIPEDDYVGLKPLDVSIKEREKERERRARSYGSLDRRFVDAEKRLARLKRICNCGAALEGGLHKETCPVVVEARSEGRRY